MAGPAHRTDHFVTPPRLSVCGKQAPAGWGTKSSEPGPFTGVFLRHSSGTKSESGSDVLCPTYRPRWSDAQIYCNWTLRPGATRETRHAGICPFGRHIHLRLGQICISGSNVRVYSPPITVYAHGLAKYVYPTQEPQRYVSAPLRSSFEHTAWPLRPVPPNILPISKQAAATPHHNHLLPRSQTTGIYVPQDYRSLLVYAARLSNCSTELIILASIDSRPSSKLGASLCLARQTAKRF